MVIDVIIININNKLELNLDRNIIIAIIGIIIGSHCCCYCSAARRPATSNDVDLGSNYLAKTTKIATFCCVFFFCYLNFLIE